METEVVVKNDYDGFFENFVRRMIEEKKMSNKPFLHKKIVITSGPWRDYVVQFTHEGCMICDEHKKKLPENEQIHAELHLDFYAAFRKGFGQITESEVAELIKIL